MYYILLRSILLLLLHLLCILVRALLFSKPLQACQGYGRSFARLLVVLLTLSDTCRATHRDVLLPLVQSPPVNFSQFCVFTLWKTRGKAAYCQLQVHAANDPFASFCAPDMKKPPTFSMETLT